MQLQAILATTAAVALTPLAATAQEFEAEVEPLLEWQGDAGDLYQGASVDTLLEADVVGDDGEEIGSVENVLFDTEGNVLSLVAEIGGFLEMGDTHVSVPWGEVEVGEDAETVAVPVTQDTVEEYSLFTDERVTAGEADEAIQQVEGDNPGLVDTGPRVWRASEFIGDYARIQDGGDGYVNYGYVSDLIVQDGAITSAVVRPDVTWGGARSAFAFPYYGYDYGWTPGSAYYDIPYDEGEVAQIERLDYGQFDGS